MTPTAADMRELPELPTPGRVVEVRGSTWAVTDVVAQGLLRSPADESVAGRQHVVALQSLDEDRLGEELRVIWELEVGHTLAPDRGLPVAIQAEAFDDPDTLGAFVDAVRWGAVTSADDDAYQSPFRSGVNIHAYQLEPLRRALQSPRTNLLLADDVGLGKTIEAGLVIQELLLRHRARTVIIVCPPSLSLKWQDEMREKFGLDFVIVNSERMAEVRRQHGLNANPLKVFPRVIVSMAWIASARAQRLLRDVYADADARTTARRYAFDLLVVDEAHHVAPAAPAPTGGNRGYAVDSLRTIHTRDLAARCEHRLFLTATPHNGHTESFTALMEMIDNRRFSRGADLDEEALRQVAVRRLKTELPELDFKARRVIPLPFEPDDAEQFRFDELSRIIDASRKAAGPNSGGDLVGLLLKKRFLSSPWSFGRTLARLADSASPRSGTADLFDDDAEALRELVGSEASDEEEGLEAQPEFAAMRRRQVRRALSTATLTQLNALAVWGLGFEATADSRLKALIDWLDGVCRIGDTWSNERVVIFTEYADTLDWLAEVLRSQGYGPVLGTIQGSTSTEQRERTRQQFSADPSVEPVRVLVATDSAGEGIDLQAHCHRLVNFDIPFNPSRLEQRIGRIDRYGQTAQPQVFHFVPAAGSSTYVADLDFLTRIAKKVSTVAADLGSVNHVVDADIQRHFLPRARKTQGTVAAQDGNAIITRTLAGGLELNRRLSELARTYDQRKHDMHLTAANSFRVVREALRLSAEPPLVLVGDERTDAQVFEVPVAQLSAPWQRAAQGLDTLLKPGEYRPITFDDSAAASRDDLVHVHLGHGLAQKSARVLRTALFSSAAEVNRVTAVVLDGLEHSCAAVVARMVLVGRGGLRLHEEVFLAGIRINAQELATDKIEALLEAALDPGVHTQASLQARESLAAEWNAESSRIRSRLEAAMARKAERLQERLTGELRAREQADTARAHEIFANFRRNLNDSVARLQHEDDTMLPLADEQAEQRRRDIRRMHERLDSLADEERREVAAITERYTDIKPYVSAAAVVFALTRADDERGGLR